MINCNYKFYFRYYFNYPKGGYRLKQNNKFGLPSLLTVIANIAFFFIFNRPDVDVNLGIIIFITLSVFGVLFSILSKRIEFMIISIPLNIGLAIVAIFQLLSVGTGNT